jgi:uncharacterized damage-inducible protein DinB
MDIGTYFSAQAYNNAWSNYRLHGACRQLSHAELAAERASFFPSIIKTLNHIFTVDWFYVSALEGDSTGYAAFEPEFPYADIEDLIREQRAMDARLIAVCKVLAASGWNTPVTLVRGDLVDVEQADRILLHVFQHQIHHRGQAHAMLSGTRVSPPQLDEFFLGSPREQAFRQHDFAAMGIREDDIWGPA